MDVCGDARLDSELGPLGASAHLLIAYRSHDERLASAARFLRIGLERRERCVYIESDAEPPGGVLPALEALGVEVGAAVDSGALTTVAYPGPYLDGETFDPDHVVRRLEQADVAARGQGFSGYRWAGDLSSVLTRRPGVDRLAEYEAKASALARERPIALLCEYDQQRLPPEIIHEIIAAHPFVVAAATVCRNPYHVPVSPDRPANEINWVLDDIAELQRSEDALRASERRYRALSRQLLGALERERRSLGLELHDEIGQLLTAIRLTLQGRPRKGRLAEAVRILDKAMEEVGHLVVALRPPTLDQAGLRAALRTLVERQAPRTELEIQLLVHGAEERLPSEVETACFRVVQEALANAVRHSRARRVEVELSASEDSVELTVRDDGDGFDLCAARARAAEGASLGLVGMEARVALAGGRLEIVSDVGRGTTVFARLPVPRAAARS